jgi:hypothetical protein
MFRIMVVVVVVVVAASAASELYQYFVQLAF